MQPLNYHSDVLPELDALCDDDVDAYITLMNFFDLIESDNTFRARLHQTGTRYDSCPLFEVKLFESLLKTGRQVRLIRLHSEQDGALLKYRTSFGSDMTIDAHTILLISERNALYDEHSPEHSKVASRYDDCRLPIVHTQH